MVSETIFQETLFSSLSASQTMSLESLYTFCKLEEIQINKEEEKFLHATNKLSKELLLFKKSMEDISLISAIVFWAKNALQDAVDGEKHVKNIVALIKNKIIQLDFNETIVKLKNYPLHQIIIDSIRSQREATVEILETYVHSYLNFATWLSKITYGFIPYPEDLDRKLTARRLIPFERYLKLMTHLQLRERVLAKLFYFGNNPTREEIFSLTLNDINFEEHIIKFPNRKVCYPHHVFDDLKTIVGDRREGFVFATKKGQRLSFSVPYRKFKNTVAELKMEHPSTFIELSLNVN